MIAIRLQLDSASHAAGLLCDARRLSHADSYRVASASRVALRRSPCRGRRSDREGQTG
jgi:hypothetical protein